jgi:hypothetical protein
MILVHPLPLGRPAPLLVLSCTAAATDSGTGRCRTAALLLLLLLLLIFASGGHCRCHEILQLWLLCRSLAGVCCAAQGLHPQLAGLSPVFCIVC